MFCCFHTHPFENGILTGEVLLEIVCSEEAVNSLCNGYVEV
jgi:hypothetical protein